MQKSASICHSRSYCNYSTGRIRSGAFSCARFAWVPFLFSWMGRNELACLLACFNTAENEPCEVCPLGDPPVCPHPSGRPAALAPRPRPLRAPARKSPALGVGVQGVNGGCAEPRLRRHRRNPVAVIGTRKAFLKSTLYLLSH